MNTKNTYLIVSGSLTLLTALVHTFAGQLDLVRPLLESNITVQAKSEWLAVWHMITIFIFATAFYLLRNGFGKSKLDETALMKFIGIIYCLISIPFIVSGIYFETLAPQWIILMPIGILALVGIRKNKIAN